MTPRGAATRWIRNPFGRVQSASTRDRGSGRWATSSIPFAIASIDPHELSDPAAWATPEATARSSARHEEAKLKVAELYERWEAVAG